MWLSRHPSTDCEPLKSQANVQAIVKQLPELIETSARAAPDSFTQALETWEVSADVEPLRTHWARHLRPLFAARIQAMSPGPMRYVDVAAELASQLATPEQPLPERALERRMILLLASLLVEDRESAGED